jgi:thiamine-phosphate pyrophosphorylase
MRRGELLDLARRLAPRVSLIVNDHADIAVMAGAAGVHVGPEDLSVEAVRRSVGDRLIVGASAQTPEEARAAVAAGASYIGSGPAFPTATKTSKDVIGPRGVAAVAAAVTVPVFAIGGITAQRVPEVRAAGLERVCAISALAGGAEPARAFLEALS